MNKKIFEITLVESKIEERIFIYCSILSLLGIIFLVTGVFDLFLPREAIALVFFVFPIISILLVIWGLGLIINALDRKIMFWTLIVATLFAGSYAYVVFVKILA